MHIDIAAMRHDLLLRLAPLERDVLACAHNLAALNRLLLWAFLDPSIETGLELALVHGPEQHLVIDVIWQLLASCAISGLGLS